MSDVTRILDAIQAGDKQAAEQLLPLVYDELRRLAAQKMAEEKSGQDLSNEKKKSDNSPVETGMNDR